MGPEGVKCHFRGIGSRFTRRRVPSPSAGEPRVTCPSPALTQRQRLVPAPPRAPGEARAPASHPLESRRGVDLCPTGNRRSPASVRPLPPCGSQAPAGPERLCPRTRPGAAVPTRVRHTDAQRLPHSFLGPPKRCFRWRLACAVGKLFPVSFAETSRGGGRTARRPRAPRAAVWV